jgi:transcriptional regulator
MYLPSHYQETDTGILHALIRAHPLGAWVTPGDGALVVNHIPFLIDSAGGELGTLIGHVARPNPVWRQCSRELPSVVIFQGPDHYISPSWYPSKADTGKVVPTWNYAVVHAHGVPRVFEDRDRLLAHVMALTNTHESSVDASWRVSDAPADFVEALLKGIVGIEIPIATLTGKWKVSQNRPEVDKQAVVNALRLREDDRSHAMATLVDDAMRHDRTE